MFFLVSIQVVSRIHFSSSCLHVEYPAIIFDRSDLIFHSFSKEVLNTEREARRFQDFLRSLRMLMNDKIMNERFYCMNSTKS